MRGQATIFVVDDDATIRKSMSRIADSINYPIKTYESAEEFLQDFDSQMLGCLISDVRLPGMTGIELQQALIQRDATLPMILISGFADVQMAVTALEAGALAFLEKPVCPTELIPRIEKGIKRHIDCQRRQLAEQRQAQRFSSLTPRERDVLKLVVEGKMSKNIAQCLQIGERTVETHRAHLMKKLNADSVAHLVAMALENGVSRSSH